MPFAGPFARPRTWRWPGTAAGSRASRSRASRCALQKGGWLGSLQTLKTKIPLALAVTESPNGGRRFRAGARALGLGGQGARLDFGPPPVPSPPRSPPAAPSPPSPPRLAGGGGRGVVGVGAASLPLKWKAQRRPGASPNASSLASPKLWTSQSEPERPVERRPAAVREVRPRVLPLPHRTRRGRTDAGPLRPCRPRRCGRKAVGAGARSGGDDTLCLRRPRRPRSLPAVTSASPLLPVSPRPTPGGSGVRRPASGG